MSPNRASNPTAWIGGLEMQAKRSGGALLNPLSREMNMNFNFSSTDRRTSKAGSKVKRASMAVALGTLLLVQLSTQAQAAPATPVFSDPIVGTWNVIVDIYNCDTGAPISTGGQALALFNADGTRHEAAATNPALRTPGYGNWHRVAKNEYEFAFKFFRFDGTGAFIGSTSVRHDLFLSADGTSYFSEGPAEFFTAANNPMFVACASATATRYE